MIARSLLLAAVFLAVPTLASAQVDASPPPSFGASIALHATAAVSSTVATGLLVGAAFSGIGCSFGGSSCEATLGLSIVSAVLGVAGLALGISASAVHANTRAQLQASYVRITPLVWGDATGGGGGLTLRF
jgi:hypothetical protein